MRIRVAFVFLISLGLAMMDGCRVFKADPQIAFLGDSITQGWSYPSTNFGVYGNTTAQMLARFPHVIGDRRFKMVVILGGTNDVLLNINADESIQNLELLGDAAVLEHAEPVLCEIPPIFHSLKPGDTRDYLPAVVALNRRISRLALLHHWKLVDYYAPLADRPDFLSDGVHMKHRGYVVMEFALLKHLPAF